MSDHQYDTTDRSMMNTLAANRVIGGHLFDRLSAETAFVDIVLTPAEMADLHNTPVAAIAAPGAGKAVMVLSGFLKSDGAGTAYGSVGGADGVSARYVGETDVFVALNGFSVLSASGGTPRCFFGWGSVNAGTSDMVLLENTAVELDNPSDGVTAGTSIVTVRLFYRIIDTGSMGA